MAGIETTTTFASGDQVTAGNLNGIISNAKLNSSAVDGSTMSVNGSGVLSVDTVTNSNIANGAITTSKIADIANNKVLGNISGSSAAPTEVATTDVSKAGFDPQSYTTGDTTTLPNGLIIKFGRETGLSGTSAAINYGASFTSVVSAQVTAEEAGTQRACSIDNIAVDHIDVIYDDGTSIINWFVIGK
jgi:hypothetical protein